MVTVDEAEQPRLVSNPLRSVSTQRGLQLVQLPDLKCLGNSQHYTVLTAKCRNQSPTSLALAQRSVPGHSSVADSVRDPACVIRDSGNNC